jgi:hypothetical protein
MITYSDADADCAGCPNTGCSMSGFYIFLGDNLVSWLSKLQHTLFHSSAKAEYGVVANVIVEASGFSTFSASSIALHRLLTVVFCVNASPCTC